MRRSLYYGKQGYNSFSPDPPFRYIGAGRIPIKAIVERNQTKLPVTPDFRRTINALMAPLYTFP